MQTMQKLTRTALLSAALLASTQAYADCDMPAKPNLPDGSTASMEEMVAGQGEVKAFQAGAVAYRECMEGMMEAAKAAAAEGDADAEADYAEATEKYNMSVEAEEEVAASFNAAIKAFKAANPG